MSTRVDLALILLAASAGAQTPHHHRAAAHSAPASAGAAEAPGVPVPKPVPPPIRDLDLAAESIPPTFAGTDPAGLMKPLVEPKGEFESTADYQKRISSAFEPGKAYPFQIDRVKASMLRVKYDADKQLFHIELGGYPSFVGNAGSHARGGDGLLFLNSIRIVDATEKTGSFVGTNAYGASVNVDRIKETAYELAWARPAGQPMSAAPLVSCDVPCPSAEAPALKDNLALVVFVEVAPVFGTRNDHPEYPALEQGNQWVTVKHRVSEATISDPIELYSTTYILGVKLRQILVYDKSSGKILNRVAF